MTTEETIEIRRIRSTDATYAFVRQLLTTSFPPEEYRDLKEWERYTDEKEEFHNQVIVAQDKPIGLFSYWDFGAFAYGEHFAIDPQCRNHGYGRKVIEAICKQLNKPLVLEVEMPDNELARRRIEFYRRQGFQLWESPYQQPPYQAGYPTLPMYLMVYGDIEEKEFDAVTRIIHREVYGVRS